MPSMHAKEKKRRRLLRAQRGLCWLCGKPLGADVTFDHLIPKTKGGKSVAHNLKLAHRACNNARGADMSAVFIEGPNGIVALRWNVRSIDHA